MFIFAILTILYSYSIFTLGVTHLLYKESVFLVSVLYVLFLGFFLRKNISLQPSVSFPKGLLEKVVLAGLGLLILINSIGVFGPETSFDALWYHLTFPKLYLEEHLIRFIPGGLMYYSVMPKLGELLFVPALAFGDETLAKAIQFVFGILTTFVIYKSARLYFSSPIAFLASLIFYSNIVVAWESTVAYIDLIRAFFEILAFYAFLLWYEKKKIHWLVLCSVMVGGAMATKILALGSLGMFIVLLVWIGIKQQKKIKSIVQEIALFSCISVLLVVPWLGFAYGTTGNPFYPFFTDIYASTPPPSILSIQVFVSDVVKLLLFSEDPISPIYLIVLPFVIVLYKKFPFPIKLFTVYAVLSLLLWYITPRTGGGRFLLPYLPVFSLVVGAVIDFVRKEKTIYYTLVGTVLCIALITIGYRGIANSRYIPVLFGQETKDAYLSKQLNYSFGDFYDTDGYLKNHIKESDKVLLYGFHNLYYVHFPFIDSSWVKTGDVFTHIATQHTPLPQRFAQWQLVYENPQTSVRLYKNGERKWRY